MATLTNLFKALSLAQIKDINIDSLKDNQILQYDELSKKWKNVTNSSISPPTYEFESGTTNGTFNVKTTIGKTTETTAVSIYGLASGAYADTFTLDETKVPVLSTAVSTTKDDGKYVQYSTKDGWVLSDVSTTGGGTSYTLLAATDKDLGGIKVGYTSNGSNYAVKLDKDNAYVTVPWTDTNTTYTAGGGLKLDTTTFSIKLDTTAVAITGTTPAIPATSGLSTGTNGLRVDNTRVPVLSTAVTTTTATGYVHWTGSAWDLSTPAGGGTSASYTTDVNSGISIDSTSNKISVDTAVIPKRYSLTVNPINKPTQTISINGVNFTLLYAADTSILTLQCDSIIQSPSSITIINMLSKKTSSKIFTITTDTKLSIDIPSMDMLTYPSGIIINMVI